jgi:hypothetical protein
MPQTTPQSTGDLIAILTDFGYRDPFVGIMKAVIHGIHPAARCIDLTHGIDQGHLAAASFILYESYQWFPPGTIFLVVVDPGVGTERRPLAVRAHDRYWVAPDNGVLGWILNDDPDADIVTLDRPEFWNEPVSQTFHGRDVFSPIAAHLAAGCSLEKMGTLISDPVMSCFPPPQITAEYVAGTVIYSDHFGNLITDIREEDMGFLSLPLQVRICDRSIFGVKSAYGDESPGSLLALIGSHGFLEVALAQGSARDTLRAREGDPVLVESMKTHSDGR